MIDIELDGEPHQMRFTLGAIEEIEEAFGEEGAKTKLTEVFENSESWSARDVSTIFMAGLKRGSLPDATREEVADMLVFSDFQYYAEQLSIGLNAANTGKAKLPDRPTKGAGSPKRKKASTSTN
jgi:hypothetical protein